MLGALVAGVARRSFLSLTAVFVVAGFVLGEGGLEILEFDPRSGFVEVLAVVALVLILFRDGLEVEAEMLQKAWHVPFRALVLAMPLTGALIACAAVAMTDLSWTEAFLLGALLSPTDPVLSSSVVTNPRVPRFIRHSLNLESGLNDGLALTAVLALLASLNADEGDFEAWRFILQDVSLGVITGLLVGYVASRLMPRTGDARAGDNAASEEHVCARHRVRCLRHRGPSARGQWIHRRVRLRHHARNLPARHTRVLRGTLRGRDRDCQAGNLRRVRLASDVREPLRRRSRGRRNRRLHAPDRKARSRYSLRLAGTRVSTTTKAFMAWFGPKGVATMAFGLLVLAEGIPSGERIFYIAALTVFCSIIAHGLTDTPGANWIANRAESGTGEKR